MSDPSQKRGKLIALEGLGGSGKTTTLNMIAEAFEEWGIPAIAVSGTQATPLAKQLYDVAVSPENRKASPTTMALMFNAMRRDIFENVIAPALNEGKMVIVDRYTLTTLAIQSASEYCLLACEIGTNNTLPDYTVIVDVDIPTLLERIKTRNRQVSFDKLACEDEFVRQAKILDNWAMVYKDNTIRLDGSVPYLELNNEVYRVVRELLLKIDPSIMMGGD